MDRLPDSRTLPRSHADRVWALRHCVLCPDCHGNCVHGPVMPDDICDTCGGAGYTVGCSTCGGTGFDPECCKDDPIDDPVGMTIDGDLIYHDCDPCPTCGPKRCAACETSLRDGEAVLVCAACAHDAAEL